MKQTVQTVLLMLILLLVLWLIYERIIKENHASIADSNVYIETNNDMATEYIRLIPLELPENSAGFNDDEYPNQRIIHPACLIKVTDKIPEGNFSCDISNFNDVERKGNLFSISFDKTGTYGWESGYIGYNLEKQGVWENRHYYLMTMFWNGGGSGTFYQNLILARAINSNIYTVVARTIHGDRCNDGNVADLTLQGARLQWSQAATPFRLLNFEDRTNWRMGQLAQMMQEAFVDELKEPLRTLPEPYAGLQPYNEIANSAAACVGRLHKTFDLHTQEFDVIGVTLNLERWQAETQGSKADCLHKWAESYFVAMDVETFYMPISEWDFARRDLVKVCH